MSKRAVLYARVSTDEQAEKGYGIPTQFEALRKYAAEHGFTIASEFRDDYSGAKLDRPGLTQVRRVLERREAEAVICHSVDRLTRNPAHAWELAETWHRAGIELHFCNRGQAEATPQGTMTYGFESLFAYYYRAKTIEATVRGRKAKAQAGKWVGSGSAPYGYRREGKRENARLVIDEREAEMLQHIFRLYLGHNGQPPMPLKTIAAKLTAEGVPSPNRRKVGKGWHCHTLKQLLTRRTCLGEFEYAEYVTRIPELAFISEHTWQQAQKRRERNKALSKRNQRRQYLLSGYFRCICGRSMAGHTLHPNTKPRANYECTGQLVYRHLCDCREKPIRLELADSLVWNYLLEPALLRSWVGRATPQQWRL